MSSLANQVIIVTGASRGIGAAAAIELARQGARISLAARTAAACNNTLQQISDAGGEAFAASC
ncbi:MAG: short-chain dehydrogenase, partial [Sneathiella sp.]